jgi:predicted nucleotidyltransferase
VNIFSPYHHRILETLSNKGVNFLIVGGVAAIYYGVRRSTGDLDILVEPTEMNGERVLEALRELRFEPTDIQPSEFTQSLFLGIGLEPDAIDIFTSTPGIQFDAAIQRASIVIEENLKVPFISLSDLIANKEQLKREGEKKLLDEFDVKVLKNLSGPKEP